MEKKETWSIHVNYMAFIMQLLYTEMYATRPVMNYYDIWVWQLGI